jgi:hypothetical protein
MSELRSRRWVSIAILASSFVLALYSDDVCARAGAILMAAATGPGHLVLSFLTSAGGSALASWWWIGGRRK